MLHALGHKFNSRADVHKQCGILSNGWHNVLLPAFLKYASESQGVDLDDGASCAGK